MFVDYYGLLEISIDASLEEIKRAFKSKALEWHPDRNSTENAEEMMKLINEAYLILKDPEARAKYDIEYLNFMRTKTVHQESQTEKKYESERGENTNKTYYDYEVLDDELRRWILNARAQAVELAKQTIQDLKGVAGAGVSGAISGAISAIGSYIGISILITIIFSIARGCS